jgi:tetratricopeptide (TPR) repeat protein
MMPDEPFASSGEASSAASAATDAAAGSQFEWNTIEPPAPDYHADSSASFADLNDDVTNSAGESFSFSGSSPRAGRQTDDDASSSAANADASSVLAQELEGVDFYLKEGYTDIARDTLDMLERQYGEQRAIAERRAQLADIASIKEAEQASPTAAPEAAQAVDFSFQFDEVPVDEAAAPEAAEIIAASDAGDAFAFNEASVKSSTTPPVSVAATNRKTDSATPHAGIDPGLAAIFDEFREAVEEEQPLQDGDFETHYNMGLAYKEMDLLDQAVEEFQNAAGMVAPGDGTPRYLNCCNLLGHCFMSKQVPRAAVIWFKKGLDAPGHTDDEYQALRYELGAAYERMGDLAKAIDTFTEVYGTDVSYRGVAERLRDLQAQQAAK